MTSPPVTILLDDKRRRVGLWWQKLQHGIGGVPLLLAGVHRLQSPGGGGDLFAIAEIAVAGVLLVLLARELRSEAAALRARDGEASQHAPSSHAHAGPDWVDVVAGALLIIEAGHSVHPGGKPIYAHATFLAGIATAMVGLFHGKLARLSWKRREIRFDESGVHVRTSRFRRFSVAWSDVRGIRITQASIAIETIKGSRAIPLWPYRNAGEIRAAFERWSAMRLASGAP
jgi:hypothetical protein